MADETIIPPIVAQIIADYSGFTTGAAKVKASSDELASSVTADNAKIAESAKTAGAAADAQASAMGLSADKAATAFGAAADKTVLAQGKIADSAKAAATEVGLASDAQAASAGKAAAAQEDMAVKSDASSTKMSGLAKAGEYVTLGLIGVAAASLKAGIDMQSMTTQIANASGVSVSAAQKITDAFQTTIGKSEFSANQLGTAFASVAGSLKLTEGHALSAGEALKFMTTATDLAEASGTSLTSSTQDLGLVMQAFHIKANDAATAANNLFEASRATGVGIDQTTTALDRAKTKLGEMAPPLNQMSALLVDMAKQGQTGRLAMTTLTSTMTTLLKPVGDVTKAQEALKIATDNLPPSLQKLAQEVQGNTLSSTQLSAATKIMSGSQQDLFKAFVTANTAVDAANQKQQQLGLTVLTNKGTFVGFGSIITQLSQQVQGLTNAQAVAKLMADGFGASSAKLLALVQAGPAAFNAATNAVNAHNAVVDAAAKQQATLQAEWATALATIKDLAAQLGTLLIPVFTTLGGVVASVAGWFDKNKTAAEALAVVVAGVLSLAVGVFVEQKVASLITGVQTMITDFGKLATALIGPVSRAFGTAGTAVEGIGTDATATAGVVETESGAMATSLETLVPAAAEADTAITTIGADATATAAVVDTSTATMGAGFTAMLGPIGLVAVALTGLIAFAPQIQALGNSLLGLGQAENLGASATAAQFTAALKKQDPQMTSAQIAAALKQATAAGSITPASTGAGGLTIPNYSTAGTTGASTSGPTAANFAALFNTVAKADPAAAPGTQTGTYASTGAIAPGASGEAAAILAGLGDPQTTANIAQITQWMAAEGGSASNPLNTTLGQGNVQGSAIKGYGSEAAGISATDQTLTGNSAYSGILAALKSGTGAGVKQAIIASPWDGSAHYAGTTYGSTAASGTAGGATASQIAGAVAGAGSSGSTSSAASIAAAAKQMAADTKAAMAGLQAAATAAHTTSLAKLDTEVTAAHTTAIASLVTKLDATHSTKLEAMASKIAADWKTATDEQKSLVDADTKAGNAALNMLVSKDHETGMGLLTGSVAAIHTKSLAQLDVDLDAAHTHSLADLVLKLTGAHSTALSAMAGKIEAAYQADEAARTAIIDADTKSGQTMLAGLVNDTTETSLTKLDSDLNQTHETTMMSLVNKLDATHNAALVNMAGKIENTWGVATANQTAQINAASAATILAAQQSAAAVIAAAAQEAIDAYNASVAAITAVGNAASAAESQATGITGAGVTLGVTSPGAAALAQEAVYTGGNTGASLAAILPGLVGGIVGGDTSDYAGWSQLFGGASGSTLGAQFSTLAYGNQNPTDQAGLLSTVSSELENLVTYNTAWQAATAPAAVPAMAAGGIVTRPTLAQVGESGPEAVIPLSKLGSFGSGATGGSTITNNIYTTATDPNALANELSFAMRQFRNS